MGQSSSAFALLFVAENDGDIPENDDADSQTEAVRFLGQPSGCCGASPFTGGGLPIFSRRSRSLRTTPSSPAHSQHVPLKSTLEHIPLRTCRDAGWKSNAETVRRRQLTKLASDMASIRQKQDCNCFSTFLRLCQLHWELDTLIRQTEPQVTELREWVTYFISPLVALDVILGTVTEGAENLDSRRSNSDSNGGYISEPEFLTNHCPVEQELSKAQSENSFSKKIDRRRQTSSYKRGRLEPACVARWVSRTFPFIKKRFVLQQIKYLHQRVQQNQPCLFVAQDVLELFFKKQLPTFLEDELKATSNFLKLLQSMDHEIHQLNQRFRLDLKHAYVSLMSQKLLTDATASVTLNDYHLSHLFHEASSKNLSKYICMPYAATLPGTLDFLTAPKATSHTNEGEQQQQQPNHRCLSPLVSVTSPPSGPSASSVFPVPPLPPAPVGPADPQALTMKTVDSFCQRCFLDLSFFKSVLNEYRIDYPTDTLLCWSPRRISSMSFSSLSSSQESIGTSSGLSTASMPETLFPKTTHSLLRYRSVNPRLVSRVASPICRRPSVQRAHTWNFMSVEQHFRSHLNAAFI